MTAAENAEAIAALSSNADQIWILLCGFLVFWMHAGFAMLEAGSVRAKNTVNILFKNVGTICISAICYFVVGYAWAYGDDEDYDNKFIGNNYYALIDVQNPGKHSWFFQFAFAATASTILSGAIAGRARLEAYLIACVFITAFIYPVVSHWVWASDGWLSAFNEPDKRIGYSTSEKTCGMIDYAGSGVVHLVGGCLGLAGAIMVGARGKNDDGTLLSIPGHNQALCGLGVLILWFGWFGFNCGSTLAFDGNNASKVAVTTVLSPSAAAIVGIGLDYALTGLYHLPNALNCVLAGLVSITAGCPVVEDWAAIFVGALGALVYMGASKGMKAMGIDDPVDAVAVHGACGIWGCLAVGIFGKPSEIVNAYSGCPEAEGNTTGLQFGIQFVGVIAIMAWTLGLGFLMFGIMSLVMTLKVDEAEGLDVSEHGDKAYVLEEMGDAKVKKIEAAEKE